MSDKYASEGDKFIAFAGSSSPFSNFYKCIIRDGDIVFTSSEQYFMYLKAIHFNDKEIAQKIRLATTPKEAKELGRKIKLYDDVYWTANREQVMLQVLIAKFTQNKYLLEKLLATGDKVIIEASPWDKIWGVGKYIGVSEDPSTWNGQNLLGKALMKVRETLA